jgi:hypothetical protein
MRANAVATAERRNLSGRGQIRTFPDMRSEGRCDISHDETEDSGDNVCRGIRFRSCHPHRAPRNVADDKIEISAHGVLANAATALRTATRFDLIAPRDEDGIGHAEK